MTELAYEGIALNDWARVYPRDYLPDAGVGLWQIASHGRELFLLSGDRLVAYVRLCLHMVMINDGQLVKWREDGWEPDDSYGSTPDEIVENVIRAWQAAGEPEPEWGEWWFVLPRDFKSRVKV